MPRASDAASPRQSARASGQSSVTQVARDQNVYNYYGVAQAPQASQSMGLVRPVDELDDPYVLEVHRAIEAHEAPGNAARELPQYVPRDHDRRLARDVGLAETGRSVLAVLVGGSSTGKTRACWEAVRAPGVLQGWRLWHPIDPGRPQALLAGLTEIVGRTVVWLNETQHYLLTPGSDLGERVAAGLRELLRDPSRGPVLVLGTLWPEYFQILTSRPKDAGEPDRHAQARALLEGAEIPVPDAFTGSALAALRSAAAQDSRLALAVSQARD